MKVENAVVLNTKKEKRKQGGGGLWVEWGQVDQYGGDFSFLHCSSFFGGGIALLSSKIHQRDGSMSFHDCIAERYGGGMLIKHSKVFFTAHVSFSSCRASGAKGSGGAMAVFDNASLTSDKAEVRVHNCSAMKGGGFSIVQSSFTQHGGQLQLHHCSASDQGGGFFLESGKFEVGGTILVDTCTATSGGGGIFLEDHMQFHVYKDITFSNCRQVGTPSGFGGGLEVHNSDIVQSGGNVVFDRCESAGSGGAAYVHKSRWKQVAGALKVANCAAHGGGGGGFALKDSQWKQVAGALKVVNCAAHGGGGGGFAFSDSHLEQFRGEMVFSGCSSRSYGGGLDFSSNSSLKQVGGIIQLQSCEAKLYGGCMNMLQGLFDANGTMRFFNCSARIKPALHAETDSITISTLEVSDAAAVLEASEKAAVYASGALDVKKLEIQNVRQRNFAMSAAALTVRGPLDCRTANHSCFLYAESVQVAKVVCPRGSRLHLQSTAAGCDECDRPYMQLKDSATLPCTLCPDEGTKRCEPGQIEMQKGFMIEVLNSDTNDLKVHHCLNPKACPGGLLPDSASRPMCTPGYTGKACLFCEARHATSDSDALSCVKCAGTFWMKTSQFCWIIMKDVLIFLIAYRGGLEAVDTSGKQKDSKTSSILLNQFMAFGSVASIAVLAALNTGGARDLQDKLGPEIGKSVQNLFGLSQELSPGEAGGGISTQCLASYMGLPRSAWMAHILSSVVPLVLILSFAIANNVALACIVGSNCFLPAFCASFSKYIVYVQTRKHSTVFTYKDLPRTMTPFAGFLCFGSVTLLCFVIAIATWSRVALSKNPKVPPHVAYLRRPYKTGCAMMEVERLSRKMILKTFSAALPITVYPILQLTMVITVMLFPLCLYTHLKPYKKSWLNKSEVFLIISGVIVACLANLITASDQHWSTRPETQEALLLILGFIATAVSFTLGILILIFMYAEFRGGAHADELDDVM